jgi:hypothetical protein
MKSIKILKIGLPQLYHGAYNEGYSVNCDLCHWVLGILAYYAIMTARKSKTHSQAQNFWATF